MSNTKKVALITGGARGIGLGIARCLALEGCHLAINGVRDEQSVAPALAELRELGADVIYCRSDVADTGKHAAMMERIRDTFGRLDVLVNNAGVAPEVRTDLLEATEESYDRVMGINLRGPYFLTQKAARWMIDQRRRDPELAVCIVNISSVSATMISPGRGEYCLSKAGISMATQLWAVRLGEFGIPVYEVRPGLIRSDMTEPVTEKYNRLIAEGVCVQARWGTPQDVGHAVALLVRGELPYSTGSVIMVDGGMTLPRL